MNWLAEISELRVEPSCAAAPAADTEDPANAPRPDAGGAARDSDEAALLRAEWPRSRRAGGELLATDGLDFARHYLRTERRHRHPLSKPEETIATELSVTGRSAWTRLFDELTSAIRVDLRDAGDPVSLDVALARLADPDRETRRSTAEAVTAALEPGLRTRTYVFNTLLQDKSIKDRLRSYPHWLASDFQRASSESIKR
jgi:oligoendopeptidase F